jgi:membrane fusion protein, multidrug efflux system
MRLALCAGSLVCALTVAPVFGQQSSPPSIPVGVVKAERKAVDKTLEIVGRVEAINSVDVRARVTGYLEDVQFQEGAIVKEGAPLYQIEKGLFEAAVEQAQGSLERSKGALTLAIIQRQRAEELLVKQAGTAVARDQAVAQEQQARGAVLSDEANLKTAQINLGYTNITSPIAGRIGRTKLTKGNVVGPDAGVLTTIVSLDPTYVTFPISQREFLKAQQAAQKPDIKGVKVRIRFSDGKMYDQVGEINFIDTSVNRGTDTILVRATIANSNYTLVDGQFVNVILQGSKPQEKLVVPLSALIADQEGVYVFAVEEGKAVVKRLKVGERIGGDITVESGLDAGELVVVEGLQTLRPGAPVLAAPARTALDRS